MLTVDTDILPLAGEQAYIYPSRQPYYNTLDDHSYSFGTPKQLLVMPSSTTALYATSGIST